ncbi:putative potassium channel protein YugO [Lentibacillus populi]|uniref:Potassium channel protein YugO n=1 Tax=Lentibacillus populi TaxID=1827502 RepID=A0A9W5TW32_9BACI|nr:MULTISPECIES: potassium channel family protein [Bacillaceae]MBT2217065.1 NAD-binding protein [Virgibacillus dakarensis]GGB36802.1 putative potassium channel protein YugO [Lentibacillus populi]
MSIEIFKHIYYRLPVFVRLLLTIFLVMILFGIIIHFVEPEQFPTIFIGVWWAFVTGATVGYGDVVPLTTTGRVIGILLILSGGGLLTFYITHISAATIQHEQDLSKGKVAFKASNHVIFVGWNERTRQLVNLTTKHDPNIEIVLIDRTLTHLPYKQFPVHFIHGDATEDATLHQANIKLAKSVVITADHIKKERQADHNTILTTVAVRGNNQHVPIVAEILSKSQIENAIRAGATTIIRSNDFMSVLLYHELFNRKETEPYETILHLLSSQHFDQVKLPDELAGKTFQQAIVYFFDKKSLLLGIIRNQEWQINPPINSKMKEGDTLLTMSGQQ